jgi:hypothetical protein
MRKMDDSTFLVSLPNVSGTLIDISVKLSAVVEDGLNAR